MGEHGTVKRARYTGRVFDLVKAQEAWRADIAWTRGGTPEAGARNLADQLLAALTAGGLMPGDTGGGPPRDVDPSRPTHDSVPRIAELIYAASDNPVRSCASSAVRTQFGLTAMKRARPTHQQIHDALVGTVTDPRIVARRERQFEEWKRSEDPSRVAVANLEGCLSDAAVEFDFSKVALTCFSYGSQPGVFAILSKRTGTAMDAARDQQRRLFGESGLKESFFDSVVDSVYGAPDEDSEFRVLEKLFGGCLIALAGDESPGAAGLRAADANVVEALAADPKAQRGASGLVYVPVSEGSGAQPRASDEVTVHYVGTLADGTQFDSSRARGRAATLRLDAAIPCWTEGVPWMKVGGKAKLICPPRIAYGDDGRPPAIPGGATLVFEVELLGVTPATE